MPDSGCIGHRGVRAGELVVDGSADEDGPVDWHPVSNTPRTTRLLQAPIFFAEPLGFVLSISIVNLSPLVRSGRLPVRQSEPLAIHLQPCRIRGVI